MFRAVSWASRTTISVAPAVEGALDGRVRLLGHQPPEKAVILSPTDDVVPADDAADALHVDGDENLEPFGRRRSARPAKRCAEDDRDIMSHPQGRNNIAFFSSAIPPGKRLASLSKIPASGGSPEFRGRPGAIDDPDHGLRVQSAVFLELFSDLGPLRIDPPRRTSPGDTPSWPCRRPRSPGIRIPGRRSRPEGRPSATRCRAGRDGNRRTPGKGRAGRRTASPPPSTRPDIRGRPPRPLPQCPARRPRCSR